MTNILLAGVGGQGTVLASKLLARAAMDAGIPVRTAETIGMAQRGGCVVSHVRIGDCASSLIPLHTADVIIGFEPAEAVRCLPYLKKGGTVIVNSDGVMPVTASLGGGEYDPSGMVRYLRENTAKCVVINGGELCEKVGSSKVLNVALLGAAAKAGLPDISLEALETAVREMVPAKFVDMNLSALHCC